MMNSELQKLLNSANAHPFLFIGSGFSRRYLEMEDWKGLVAHFAAQAKPESKMAFAWYKNEIGIQGKKDEELLPIISERVEQDFNRRFLEDDHFYSIREANSDAIDKGASPFKICVAEYLKAKEEKFGSPLHPEEISALGHSRKNTAGIVTTNFDRYLEKLYPEHVPYIGQDELLFNQNYGVGELFKIHGCVSQPETMVLTKADYEAFQSRNVYLSAKLLTVFLEHPIFFLGYSLNDANIRRIFSDIAKCLNEEQLSKLTDRLFFVQRVSSNRKEGINVVRENFGEKTIQFKQIVTDDFSVVFKAISAMKSSYSPKILRKLKKDIYELVLTNNPKERIKVVGIDESTDFDKMDYVMGVGVSHQLAEQGYEGIEVEDLVEDILFENRDFNANAIVESVLPKLGKRCSYNVPLFKYISQYEGDKLEKKLNEYIDDVESKGVGKWISNSLRKANRYFPGTDSVSALRDKIEVGEPKEVVEALMDVVFLEEDKIDLQELNEFLSEIYDSYDQILKFTERGLSTHFRRAVKMFDYLRYKKNIN